MADNGEWAMTWDGDRFFQLHVLDWLEKGRWGIIPYIAQGRVEMVAEDKPGFHRVRLRWDLTQCQAQCPLINVKILSRGVMLDHDALTSLWTFFDTGIEVIDELRHWLEENINPDYSNERRAILYTVYGKEAIQVLQGHEYYIIDDKMYYCNGENSPSNKTMTIATPISLKQAAERLMQGDYDLLPSRK